MRSVLISAAAALIPLLGCTSDAPPDVPPLGTFYFPTGLAHAPSSDPAKLGALFVASSDFDKRYDFGAVSAVDLDALTWPAINTQTTESLANPWYLTGAPSTDRPVPNTTATITDLKLTDAQRVLTTPFAGLTATFQNPDGSTRLLVPARSEFDKIFAIDAHGTTLSCDLVPKTQVSECAGVSLTEAGRTAGKNETADGFQNGKPRAPEPYAIGVRQSDGTFFVTSLAQADSPVDTRNALEAFVVSGDAKDPGTLTANNFVPVGISPTTGVVMGRRYAYVAGKTISGVIAPAVRLIQRNPDGSVALIAADLEAAFRSTDMRGIELFPQGPDVTETRAFLLGRSPDVLMVADIQGAGSNAPKLSLVRSVLLPAGVNDVKLIPRGADRGALLAISCSNANSVALYDDETGQVANVLAGVGIQPFAIAVDSAAGRGVPNATGARLYVSNFGDGTVAVIDIPDVNRPYDAYIAAKLGATQTCLTDETGGTPCTGASP